MPDAGPAISSWVSRKRGRIRACSGLDLSQASLDVASELAKLHGASVTLKRGSYLDPLPFEAQFDVIAPPSEPSITRPIRSRR